MIAWAADKLASLVTGWVYDPFRDQVCYQTASAADALAEAEAEYEVAEPPSSGRVPCCPPERPAPGVEPTSGTAPPGAGHPLTVGDVRQVVRQELSDALDEIAEIARNASATGNTNEGMKS